MKTAPYHRLMSYARDILTIAGLLYTLIVLPALLIGWAMGLIS